MSSLYTRASLASVLRHTLLSLSIECPVSNMISSLWLIGIWKVPSPGWTQNLFYLKVIWKLFFSWWLFFADSVDFHPLGTQISIQLETQREPLSGALSSCSFLLYGIILQLPGISVYLTSNLYFLTQWHCQILFWVHLPVPQGCLQELP